jgi:hypothetical protein
MSAKPQTNGGATASATSEKVSSDDPLDIVFGKAKALIDAGDKGKAQSDQQLKSAGLLLVDAAKRSKSRAEFEASCGRFGIKISRAYALMRIAKGRDTAEQQRERNRAANQKHRQRKKSSAQPSPSRDGQAPVAAAPTPTVDDVDDLLARASKVSVR